VLPVAYPVSLANFNWTCVMVALVLAIVLAAWYMPGVGAREWYHGKAHTLEDSSVVRSIAISLRAACLSAIPASGCLYAPLHSCMPHSFSESLAVHGVLP
jgi:hypothetical protein